MSIFNLKKFLSITFVASLALWPVIQRDSNTYAVSNEKFELIQRDSNICAMSNEKFELINSLLDKFELPYEEVSKFLCFNTNCYLIPLGKIEEHKNCLIDLFHHADPDYMKYYLSGKLFSIEHVESVYFERSLKRMWDYELPKSITFIIDCDGQSVGRIGIGPLYEKGKLDCEIGYAIKQSHSNKGITSAAVKSAVEFLKYVLTNKKGMYDIKRLRATAKEKNEASNKILNNIGFIKSSNLINDGYGPENEYFYYFDKN